MTEPLIRIQGLTVEREGKPICRVPALEVEAGERLGIVGPNGSGKSTLLLVLAGLDVTATGRCEVTVPVRDRVYVHQQPFLFKGDVLSNATYGLRAQGVPAKQAAKAALEWLERLGMASFANRAAHTLSGGERRRVALARAMVVRPRLLLLDEPLADLDESGAELVKRALEDLLESTLLIAGPTELTAALVTRTYSMSGSNG